jgi:hypothetical protein
MLSKQPKLPDPAGLAISPIGEAPEYTAALAELTALEKRLAETEKRRQRAVARLRGTKSPRNPLDRARDLLAGGQVGAVDPSDDIKACDEETFSILRPAIGAAAARLDEVHKELSYNINARLKPQYAAAVRAALDAISALLAAFESAAAIRARVREAGYTPLEHVVPPAVTALGDPNFSGSQAWFFRNYWENRGLL